VLGGRDPARYTEPVMVKVLTSLVILLVIAVPTVGMAGSFTSDTHGHASVRHVPLSPSVARVPATAASHLVSLLPRLACLGSSLCAEPVSALRIVPPAPFVPPRAR
jgi:hypothetical protein